MLNSRWLQNINFLSDAGHRIICKAADLLILTSFSLKLSRRDYGNLFLRRCISCSSACFKFAATELLELTLEEKEGRGR